MSKKKELLRRIDIKPDKLGGGALLQQETSDAPPAIPSLSPPTNLVLLGQTTAHNGQTPQNYINISWDAPEHVNPTQYIIEYATLADFSNAERQTTTITNAAILADVGKNYYLRVRAVLGTVVSEPSNVLIVLTTPDLTPPPDITTADLVFQNGNVVLTFVIPSGTAYRNARVRIYNGAKTILYGTYYTYNNYFIWTEAENIRLSGGITSVVVEVNSVSWQNINGTILELSETLVAPNPIVLGTVDFSTGDLVFSNNTLPTNAQFRDIEYAFYDDNTKAVSRGTFYNAANHFTYTAETNLARSGGLGDPSIYYEIKVRSWLGLTSTVVSGTITKPPVAAPSNVAHNWQTSASTAASDLRFTWDAIPYVPIYALVIDGRTFLTPDTTFTYRYSQNIVDHSPDADGDPVLTYSIYGIDRIKQNGNATAGTATNDAPPTNFTYTHNVGFDSIGIVVSPSSTAILDLAGYVGRVYESDGVTLVDERRSDGNVIIFTGLESGTYIVSVYAVDVFGQMSPDLSTAPFTIDVLTIEELRAEAIYIDDTGTVRDARLKDNKNYTTGTNYNFNTLITWKYIQQERPLINTYGGISLSLNITGSIKHYFSISKDGVNWQYFNAANADVGDYALTLVANETTARSVACTLTNSNNAVYNNGVVYTFPALYEARFIRFHFYINTSSLYVAEFYARRLLESDDIRAEVIQGIHIAGQTITGYNIFGTVLSSVKSSTGTLDVNVGGHIKSGQTAYDTGTGYFLGFSAGIGGGTTPVFSLGNSAGTKMLWNGSNLSFRFGATNNRVEMDSTGIKAYDSSNVVQIHVDTSTGLLKAAAGNITIGNNGIKILAASGLYATDRNVEFIEPAGTIIGATRSWYDATTTTLDVYSSTFGGRSPKLFLFATSSSTDSELRLFAGSGYGVSGANLTLKKYASDGNGYIIQQARWHTTSYIYISNLAGVITNPPAAGNPTSNALVVENRNSFFDRQNSTYGNDGLYSITIGDHDTGINWTGDGQIEFLSNATKAFILAGGAFFPGNQTTTALGYNSAYNGYAGIYTAGNLMSNGAILGGNWFRSVGQTGWFNETYAGGIFMNDSTYIKTYNNKIFSMEVNTSLPSAQHSRYEVARLLANSGANAAGLTFAMYRGGAGGSSWTEAGVIIQRYTDTTLQNAYLYFGPDNIGVGTVTPGYRLHLGIDSAAKPGTNTWTISSDARLKEVIGTYDKGMEYIKSLPKPVNFKYNGEGDVPADDVIYVGYLAQDLKKVDPSMVGSYDGKIKGRKTKILTVNSNQLSYAFQNALLELDKRLEALENK